MKEILDLIARKQQVFAELPFFKFLHNSRIAPQERLAFAPYFAPFVMGFGELNRAVFREESNDPIQLMINQHSREDDSHWIWFLEDLQKLKLDLSMNFNDALRFLWGNETAVSRHMIYELYRYTYRVRPIQKLVIIEAIEATADIFLSATAKAARELQENTNKEYRYFGNLHLAIDTGHSLHLSETQQFIESLELSVETKQEAIESVEKVFQLFTDFFNVLLELTQAMTIAPIRQTETISISDYSRVSKASQKQSTQALTIQEDDCIFPVQSEKRLGAYLVEAGLLSFDHLQVALSEQKHTDKRLGEVVADRGWVNQQTIDYLMEKVILPERQMASERSLVLAS
jgi:hypothetical protein